MSSLTVTLFGILDIFLEIVGALICIKDGDWFEDGNAVALYASLALDIIKLTAVIVGFVIACWADSKITPEEKRVTLSAIGITEIVIGIFGLIAAMYISVLIINSPAPYYDFRALYCIIFWGYALLKFVSFFGFAEFLKVYVRDAPSLLPSYQYHALSQPNPSYPLSFPYPLTTNPL